MADGKPKPAIPAWQRVPPQSAQGPVKSNESDHASSGEEESPKDNTVLEDPVNAQEAALSETSQLKEVKLSPTTEIKTSDFASFKEQQQQQQQQQRQRQQTHATVPRPHATPTAPVVMYPEYLMEAHKPPPLITSTGVINATYFAAGVAALVYGASQYLVAPMLDALTEARHDLSLHSQSKLSEFNDRLSKIVSRVPDEPNKDAVANTADTESITSDPTELYHRDMGTQTSDDLISKPSTSTTTADPKRDPVTYQTKGLTIIKEHLSELTDGLEKTGTSNQERQDSANSLRHQLDTMLYASPGVMLWGNGEDGMTKPQAGQDDVVEELKREIRGVKGVLLSARRFPSARVAG